MNEEAEKVKGSEAGAEAKAEAVVKGVDGEQKRGGLAEKLVEFGVTGVVVLLSLSALTYAGFAVAFMAGFEVEGAGETAGALGAAAVGWALTKPIRIPVALAITPVVMAIMHRVRGKKAPPTG